MKQTVPAKIIATEAQLNTVGVDSSDILGNLVGKEVQACDIDKYYGIGGSCSEIIVNPDNEILNSLGLKYNFIIPTKWLKFV